jgi:hypothetical protein
MTFYGQGSLACFNSELTSDTIKIIFRHFIDSLDVGSAHHNAYAYSGQHKHSNKASGIRIHYPPLRRKCMANKHCIISWRLMHR